MIRFICIAVFLILYLILSIPVFLVEWIIGKFNRRAKDISSLRIVQWGFKVILKMTGVTTTVIGEENVPDDRGDLDADFPWRLPGHGKRGSGWKNAGIFHCG